jgi:hypothetical protein
MLSFKSSSPEGQRFRKACIINDRILDIALRMSLLPTQKRLELLPECRSLCDELSTFIIGSEVLLQAIEDLYKACEQIAHLPSSEDHSDGTGACPICRNPIFKGGIEGYPVFYCTKCTDPICDPRRRIDEGMGFSLI